MTKTRERCKSCGEEHEGESCEFCDAVHLAGKVDSELRALRSILSILKERTPIERARITGYLYDRFQVKGGDAFRKRCFAMVGMSEPMRMEDESSGHADPLPGELGR